MLCIINSNTDPYFNLASEEYLLKNFTEDCFMLWRNKNAIIVGKHQNTLSEINIERVEEKKITVARRISGGGAVFHDLGNLNFTFIFNGEDGKLVDFKKFTQPILDALQELGIDAEYGGRNDLVVEGKKFSGNAEHVWRRRTLHHGTILFSSEISDLSGALKVNPLKFSDKAVKSVRSRVTNIQDYTDRKMDVLEFRDWLFTNIMDRFNDAVTYEFSESDIMEINKLREEKFLKWDWNYGYSPKYNFAKQIKTAGGTIEVQMNVEKGIIVEMNIFGDFFHIKDIDDICNSLKGTRHEPQILKEKLSVFRFEEYFRDISADEFIDAMF